MDRSKVAALAARSALLAGAAAVWALGGAARAAEAEAPAAGASTALAEVVVPAEKHETKLQQTPARPLAGATLMAHFDANFSGPQYTSTSDPRSATPRPS
jgi:hypothetical protein